MSILRNHIYGQILIVLTVIFALLSFVMAIDNLVISAELTKIYQGREFEKAEVMQSMRAFIKRFVATNMTMILLTLFQYVLLVVMSYRAYLNLRTWNGKTRMATFWVIVGWLIPLGNLVIPFMIFNEIFKEYVHAIKRTDAKAIIPIGAGGLTAFVLIWYFFTLFEHMYSAQEPESFLTLVSFFRFLRFNGLMHFLGMIGHLACLIMILQWLQLERKIVAARDGGLVFWDEKALKQKQVRQFDTKNWYEEANAEVKIEEDPFAKGERGTSKPI